MQAIHAARKGHTVTLWALETDVVDSINNERENKVFLKGHKVRGFGAMTHGCVPWRMQAVPHATVSSDRTCKPCSTVSMIKMPLPQAK